MQYCALMMQMEKFIGYFKSGLSAGHFKIEKKGLKDLENGS